MHWGTLRWVGGWPLEVLQAPRRVAGAELHAPEACMGRSPQGASPAWQIPRSALHARSQGMPLLPGQALLQTHFSNAAASLNLLQEVSSTM